MPHPLLSTYPHWMTGDILPRSPTALGDPLQVPGPELLAWLQGSWLSSILGIHRRAPRGLSELSGENRRWQAEGHAQVPTLFPTVEEVPCARDTAPVGGGLQLSL